MGKSGIAMFRGASKVTLDAKGRLAIPSRFREHLMTRADGRLVATVDRAGCLLIYPQPEWEDFARRLNALPGMKPQVREFQRVVLGNATDLEMDGQSRVLISRALRDYAELDKQAMLVVQGRKFELWDEERWNQRLIEWASGDEPLDPDLAELRV